MHISDAQDETFMVTSEQPITRSELREELQHHATKEVLRDELRHYATKVDMAQMETRLVKWMVGIMFGAAALSTSIALVIQRLVD